jgi:hypothetical protein
MSQMRTDLKMEMTRYVLDGVSIENEVQRIVETAVVWGLRYSGILSELGWQSVTDVSVKHSDPIFKGHWSLKQWLLKIESIYCPETSVTKYKPPPPNIKEQRKPQLNRSGSLESRSCDLFGSVRSCKSSFGNCLWNTGSFFLSNRPGCTWADGICLDSVLDTVVARVLSLLVTISSKCLGQGVRRVRMLIASIVVGLLTIRAKHKRSVMPTTNLGEIICRNLVVSEVSKKNQGFILISDTNLPWFPTLHPPTPPGFRRMWLVT